MDREPNPEERNESAQTDADYALMLQELSDSHTKTISSLNESLKSRWGWRGNDRVLLKIIVVMLHMENTTAEQILNIHYALENHQRKLENFEKMIDKISQKTDVDISKLKGEVKKLALPEPVRQYINEFREEWEEQKELRSRFIREHR